jgi:hypothetical protein
MHQTVDSEWKALCRIGGAAALIAGLVFRRFLSAEASLITGRAAPSTVADWFSLLQTNRLLGLTCLDVFDLVNYALVGLILLGLYAAQRRVNRSAVTLALVVGLIGVAVYFASNRAFSMLALSNEYAAATTDAQRSMLLAAGQAMRTESDFLQGGGGVNLSLDLVTLAYLVMAVVMLRSGVFGRAAAIIGMVANVLYLGSILTLAFAPSLTFIPMSSAAPFLLVWYLMIGVKLWRLGRRDAQTLPEKEAM